MFLVFMLSFSLSLSLSLSLCFSILEREKSGERGREKHRFVIPLMHLLVDSYMCLTGVWTYNLRMCPDREIEPATFLCMGWRSNRLGHPARATILFFMLSFLRRCIHTGWGKSSFTVVSMQNSLFLCYLLIMVLFFI